MVVAGTVEIVGSIDIESVKHGLKQLKQGLDEARNASRSAFGDLKRMGSTISGIAKPLATIGTLLGTTILGIAAMSPAVAPVMARMQADFLRLSRVLGEELKPIFEEVEMAFEGFVDFMGSDVARNAMSWFVNEIKDMKNQTIALQEQFAFTTPYIERFFDAINNVATEGIIPSGTVEETGIGGIAQKGNDLIKSFFDIQPGTLDFLWKPALAGAAALTDIGMKGLMGEDYLTTVGGVAAGAGTGIISILEQFFDKEVMTNQLMRFANTGQW